MHDLSDLTLDCDQAARHLALLAGDVRLQPADAPHIFAVLAEADGCRAGPRHYFGRLVDLASRLAWAQRQGCGLFVAVNAMQGRRRRNDEVARVRALWTERDGPGHPLPLPASLVIATSPGRCHEYLLTDDASLRADESRNLNRRLAEQCASDRGATDPARVLRLAGSWNVKGAPFQAHITASTGQRYAADELRAALPEPPVVEMTHAPPWSSASCPSHVGSGIHDPVRYLETVSACLVAELGAAPEGCRNTTLNRLAFRLARLGLDVNEINARLGPTAKAIGLSTTETLTTIGSAARGARRMS